MTTVVKTRLADILLRRIQAVKALALLGQENGTILGSDWTISTHRGWLHPDEDSAGYVKSKAGNEVFVAADGVGSCSLAKEASMLAVADFLLLAAAGKDIFESPLIINQILRRFSHRRPIQTTLTGLEIGLHNLEMRGCSIGNSGIMAIPLGGGEPVLLTRYHQASWETAGLKGLKTDPPLTMSDLRLIRDDNDWGSDLISCLGDAEGFPHIDLFSIGLRKNSKVVTRLCIFSDGALWAEQEGLLPEERIVRLASEYISSQSEACHAVISQAMRGRVEETFFERLDRWAVVMGFSSVEDLVMNGIGQKTDILHMLESSPGTFGVSKEEVEIFKASASLDNITVGFKDLMGYEPRMETFVNHSTTPSLTSPPLECDQEALLAKYIRLMEQGEPEENS